MPHTPEQNKAIVREFYDLAFNQRQPEAAVAKHVGGMYRQHNPMRAMARGRSSVS
jgi:predicted SnoaL-like aldol condensation-catalyzing enzyme